MFRHLAKSLGVCAAIAALLWSVATQAQETRPSAPPAKIPLGKLPGPNRPAAPAKNGPLAVPGYWVLGVDGVQKELNVTDEQKQKLHEIADECNADIQKLAETLRGLSPDEQEQRTPAIRGKIPGLLQAARVKVEKVLTPEQIKGAQKIELQMLAGPAVMSKQIMDLLELTQDQRNRIAAVREETQQKGQQLQRDLGDKVLGILTPEQTASLKKQLEVLKQQQQQ